MIVSGLARSLDDLVRALPAMGWEPTVALTEGPTHHRPEAYRQAYPGPNYLSIRAWCESRESRVQAIKRTIRKVAPDVVLGVSLADVYEAVTRLKLDGRAIRFVAPMRSCNAVQLADLRYYADFVDFVPCVSKMLCALTIDWIGLPSERVAYIPGGVTPPIVNRGSPANTALRLGYAGRLDTQKRCLDSVKLWRDLQQLRVGCTIDFYGSGPCEQQLRDAFASESQRGLVRFHGQCSQDQLYRRGYPNMDILLLFSAFEGTPRSVTEAMIHGVVPVISRYRGCVAEQLVRDWETGATFPVGDTLTAATIISKLDSDRPLLARLSHNAAKHVNLNYNIDKVNASWKDTLNRVMEFSVRIGKFAPNAPFSDSRGRLERWGTPHLLATALRRLVGRTPPPAYASDEWPFGNRGHDPQLLQQIENIADRVDMHATTYAIETQPAIQTSMI